MSAIALIIAVKMKVLCLISVCVVHCKYARIVKQVHDLCVVQYDVMFPFRDD